MGDAEEAYGVKNIVDNWEFMTEFVMEPNLGEYGFQKNRFNHNNKTWIATNLTGTDAKVVRNISENIQILNRFNTEEDRVAYEIVHDNTDRPLARYEAEGEEEAKAKLEEFCHHYDMLEELKAGRVKLQKRRVKSVDNRFDNLKCLFLDNLFGIMSSSAGRKASVMQLMRSLIHKQEQSIEDKTESKRGGFFSGLNKG